MKDDHTTSCGADNFNGNNGRLLSHLVWLRLWCVALLGFGSFSTALAQSIEQDYNIGKNGSYPVSGNLNVFYEVDVNVSAALDYNKVLTLKLLLNGNVVMTQTVQPNGNLLTYNKTGGYTSISGYNIAWGSNLDYSFSNQFSAELYEGEVLLDSNVPDAYSQSGKLKNVSSSPSNVSISLAKTNLYLSPTPSITFPDGKPNEPQPDPPTPEELAAAEKIAGMIEAGSFKMPYSAPDSDFPDGQDTLDMVLNIGGQLYDVVVEKGEKYLWDLPIPSDWDGTFAIDFWEQELDSFYDDGSGGYIWKPTLRDNPEMGDLTVDLASTAKGFVVLKYETSPEGTSDENKTYQFVTVNTNSGNTGSTVINGSDVTQGTIGDDGAPSENGNWDEAALGSAADAIEGGNAPVSGHSEWAEPTAENLEIAIEANSQVIDEWRNLRPLQSTSFPRSTSYAVSIPMGEFGTYSGNIALGHPAVSFCRSVILAAYTYLLFSAFLKKLTI